MEALKYDSTRLELINWINSLNDTNILNLLNSIRMSRKDSKKDWWDDLTEDDKAKIESGLNDLNSGKVISSKEFWNKFRNG